MVGTLATLPNIYKNTFLQKDNQYDQPKKSTWKLFNIPKQKTAYKL